MKVFVTCRHLLPRSKMSALVLASRARCAAQDIPQAAGQIGAANAKNATADEESSAA